MTLRERIKELCRKNGVSMNKLEIDLEFGKGYLSKLDKSTPNSEKLQQIADYFGVTLDYLMTGKEKEETDYHGQAELWLKIRHDDKMLNAIQTLYNLSDRKKEHVFELIDLLKEVK